MTGPIVLGWEALAGAAALVLLNGLVSLWLRLDLERRLLIASLRTVIQLSILGAILVPVFDAGRPELVAVIGLVMIALAAREAVRRTKRGYRGMLGSAFGVVLISAGSTTLLATAVLVRAEPWWMPQYLIPLLGMLLGNTLTGIALGLDSALAGLDEGRDQVELLLARGATWWEAARGTAAEAVRTGMIPIINAMSAVGLISIPGMMTGQILGGTAPGLAARYQILIMFLIAGCTAMSVTGTVLISVRVLFDSEHRLRPERLEVRR